MLPPGGSNPASLGRCELSDWKPFSRGIDYLPSALPAIQPVCRDSVYRQASKASRAAGDVSEDRRNIIFCHYMGFSRELAAFLTRIVICSWFPDCSVRPTTLCISGLDMDQVMKCFGCFMP
jgi:hypothetical protein